MTITTSDILTVLYITSIKSIIRAINEGDILVMIELLPEAKKVINWAKMLGLLDM